MRTRGVVAVGVVCCLGLFGCDFTKITANGTSGLFQRAAPAFEQHWDYDLAGGAMPGNIVQMEGLLRIVPENEIIIIDAVRLYTAYAYGWIEDRASRCCRVRTTTRAPKAQLRRARATCTCAPGDCTSRSTASRSTIEKGFEEEAYQGGLETRWLQEERVRGRGRRRGIFWAGYAWGSYIQHVKHDMVAVADLPFLAGHYVDRAVEIDPDFAPTAPA
ncbi:MAG: TRAP transporter TatT component family protein [Polyangiales bacterium]